LAAPDEPQAENKTTALIKSDRLSKETNFTRFMLVNYLGLMIK